MPGPMRRERRSGWATGVAGDAGVDDAERGADRAGEDVGGGAAGEEVQEHLPGDGLGVGGDAFVGEAVVGGEDGELAGGHPRVERGLGAGDLRGERLDAAEGAERLGLAVDPGLEAGLEVRVGGWRQPFRLLAGCRALA